MTRPSGQRALILGAIVMLTLPSLTGCAPHSDTVTAPTGVKVAAPMSAAQQQAVDQAAAARAARRNGQTP